MNGIFSPTNFLTCVSIIFLGRIWTENGVWGLSCVICDSETDPSCSSSPIPMLLQNCSKWCEDRAGFIPEKTVQVGEYGIVHNHPGVPCPPPQQFQVCRKIQQSVKNKVYTGDVFKERIIRTCGFLIGKKNSTRRDPEYQYHVSESSKSVVYNCFTDNCNSGSARTISIYCLMATLISFCHFIM